jgi:phi13 family phage major tail protein
MANSRIGAENLTLFKILTDVATGATTYDVPFAITKKLMKIGIKNSGSMDILYADDQTVDVITEDGDIGIDIDITDLTEDEKAYIFGQTMVAGVRSPNMYTDVRPYFCVSWKSKKRNLAYKYYKILKVIFKEPDEDFETKKEKAAAQTDKISGTGIQRLSDGLRKRVADADSVTWLPTTGTGWFTGADVVVDTVAPTLTVVPTNAATGVAAGAAVVWTFNKAILPSSVVADNFMLVKAGANIAGLLTINAANTIVTFTPTSALSAGVHTAIVTVGAKSASNVPLASPSVTTFTV